MKALH